MIYILAYDTYCLDNQDIGESILVASTKIDDLLGYLDEKVRIDLLSDYIVLCMEENVPLVYYEMRMGVATGEMFAKYPHHIFLKEENKREYEIIKPKLLAWCNKKQEERRRLIEERKQKEKEDNEKKERELYEKLKAKYEN